MARLYDISGIRRRVADLQRRGALARGTAAKVYADELLRAIDRDTPRDTNRMAAGFMQGANAAGLGPFDVPAVKASEKFPKMQRTLQRQLNKWLNLRAIYEREGRTGQPYYRKILRAVESATRQIELLTDTSILVQNRGRRVRWTVRHRVYGGTGRRIETPGGTFFQVRNLEPHAIIIDRRRKIVARALGQARLTGLRKVRRSYLRGLGL